MFWRWCGMSVQRGSAVPLIELTEFNYAFQREALGKLLWAFCLGLYKMINLHQKFSNKTAWCQYNNGLYLFGWTVWGVVSCRFWCHPLLTQGFLQLPYIKQTHRIHSPVWRDTKVQQYMSLKQNKRKLHHHHHHHQCCMPLTHGASFHQSSME